MSVDISYQEQVDRLLEQQIESWSLLNENLKGLKSVKIKEFTYNGFSLKLQYNPKRIKSSGAKVDKKSIEERPCFLCESNRPSEQRSVEFEDDYQILCNPYPIFSQHYTIVKKSHIPQRISSEFDRMLSLSKALPDLAIFYNGPKCGASAPDHMHFQAGNRGLMCIETDINELEGIYGERLIDKKDICVQAIDDGLRRFISIESEDRYAIQEIFKRIFAFAEKNSEEEEPMMNILSYYNDGWSVYVFLRGKHRPEQYSLKGEENILFSPASVDMGGTLIFPLEKDFEKIRKDDVSDMMAQVSMKKDLFEEMLKVLKSGSRR